MELCSARVVLVCGNNELSVRRCLRGNDEVWN